MHSADFPPVSPKVTILAHHNRHVIIIAMTLARMRLPAHDYNRNCRILMTTTRSSIVKYVPAVQNADTGRGYCIVLEALCSSSLLAFIGWRMNQESTNCYIQQNYGQRT